jgi:hypothetical protein
MEIETTAVSTLGRDAVFEAAQPTKGVLRQLLAHQLTCSGPVEAEALP